MRGALGTTVTCAVVLLLIQGCAGGMTQGGSSTSVRASAGAQSYGVYGTERYFTLEWQPHERRGKSVVSGYVTNQWGIGVNNVRLRVEALDSAGNVSATDIGYVFGDVTPGAHVYFEVPVQQKAASYRVSVLSFEPAQCRG